MSYPLFHPARAGSIPFLIPEEDFPAEFPGEGDYVEFKEGVSGRRIQEAVVAFSNTDGGVILVGVNDHGQVTGIGQPGEKTRQIHEAVHEVSSPGRYEVHEVAVGDRTVLVVAISRRHEGFAQTSDGVVRVRRGASNLPLIGVELSRFLARRAFNSFESTTTTVPFSAADPQLVQRLRDSYRWQDDGLVDRLIEEGFVELSSGQEVLTVAGALHLLRDPSDIGCRAYIDVRRYRAGEADPDKVESIRGSVADQIEEATAGVMAELGSTSAVLGSKRVDMPRLPPSVIREVVANAVAHRSYENTGTAIRVEIRDDLVRVISPGALPEPVTIENIRYQQSARNPKVLETLRRMGLAEDLGRGIDRIEDDMQADLLQPPEFEEDGAFFSVTMRLSGAVTPRERAWVRQLIAGGNLDPRSAPVVVQAARTGSITNSDVRAILGVDSVVARNVLQRLVAEGVFLQTGERGGAQYSVADGAGVPARIRHSDEELDAIVRRLAESGAISNAMVRGATGLDRLGALAVLRRLVQQDVLVQEGSRRGTTYRLRVDR